MFLPSRREEIATQNWSTLRDTRKIHRKICGASRGMNNGSTFGDNYQGDLHGGGNFLVKHSKVQNLDSRIQR